MTENPYAAPRTTLVTEPDSIDALYSRWQVGLGAALGGPFAGTWMLYGNFRALRRDNLAHAMLWAGSVLSVLWTLLALLMPERVPSFLFPLAQGGLGVYLAREFHDKDPRRIEHPNVRRKSAWRVVGAVLGGSIVSIVLMLGMALGLEQLGYWRFE